MDDIEVLKNKISSYEFIIKTRYNDIKEYEAVLTRLKKQLSLLEDIDKNVKKI